MGMQDRDWYKEDFDRRMGKASPNADEQKPKSNQQRSKIKTEQAPQLTRIERATLASVPPEYAVWAARYELALRRRAKKTFVMGFTCGVLITTAATYAIHWI